MVVDIGFLPPSLAGCLRFVSNKVVHLYITLLDLFCFDFFGILVPVDLLFICVLVIDSIIEILVIKFFVISV